MLWGGLSLVTIRTHLFYVKGSGCQTVDSWHQTNYLFIQERRYKTTGKTEKHMAEMRFRASECPLSAEPVDGSALYSEGRVFSREKDGKTGFFQVLNIVHLGNSQNYRFPCCFLSTTGLAL